MDWCLARFSSWVLLDFLASMDLVSGLEFPKRPILALRRLLKDRSPWNGRTRERRVGAVAGVRSATTTEEASMHMNEGQGAFLQDVCDTYTSTW